MKASEFKYLQEMVDQEGFDYLFIYCSDFPDIEDDTFHHLRRAYENAYHELADYIGVER